MFSVPPDFSDAPDCINLKSLNFRNVHHSSLIFVFIIELQHTIFKAEFDLFLFKCT